MEDTIRVLRIQAESSIEAFVLSGFPENGEAELQSVIPASDLSGPGGNPAESRRNFAEPASASHSTWLTISRQLSGDW